jgi:SAM-dependent methyltransferase
MLEKLYGRVEHELTADDLCDAPVILDAATGAGKSTLRLARMIRSGKVITVDTDEAAWTQFAQHKIEAAGLAERVEFRLLDIADLHEFPDGYFDLVFSGATLSTMGVHVIDGIRELHRVAKPGAFLGVYDLLPQEEPGTEPQRNAVDAWRLSKAIEVLAGERHYEELPLDWVCRRLRETGFDVENREVEDDWGMASEESIREYLDSEDWKRIQDPEVREFFKRTILALKERIRRTGMANFSRRYILFARKPAEN